MRITTNMIMNNVMRNLSLSQTRISKLQSMASSGRRISRPSDDPIGITKDLRFRSSLTEIAQFQNNINQVNSWLDFSDRSLADIDNLVIKAKDIAVQMGNSTYDASARQSAATEIMDILNQILDAANSKFENNYIFSGTKTDVKPFLVNSIGVVYQGDYSDITLQTGSNAFLKINTIGADCLTKTTRVLGDGHDLNPGLQPNTWLNNLYGGEGADLGAGIFRVRTINGEYAIDVSAARNIQDVMDALNGAGIPNFSASINEAQNALYLTENSAHQVGANTPLGLLNMGQGIDQTTGLVRFSTGGGVVVDVDVSACVTLGDVVNEINAQLPAGGIANITISISPDGNYLTITDANAPPLDLDVSEAAFGSHTAAGLGILGDVNGIKEGEDLKPYQFQVVEDAPGENTAKTLGILEGTEFNIIEGDDLNSELTYYTLLSSLNSGRGFPLGKIRIVNGHNYMEIDLSPLASDPSATITDMISIINSSGMQIEAKINDQCTGLAITSKVEGRSLMITDADSGRTTKDLGIFGSPDLLGTLMILKDSLEKDDITEVNSSLATFDGALNKVLIERSDIGGRFNRAETASARLLAFQCAVTSQLSDIEDADMTKVITDLAAADVSYQAALASAARMIGQSLAQFLK